MANKKSAKRQVGRIEARTIRNYARRARLRTFVRKYNEMLEIFLADSSEDNRKLLDNSFSKMQSEYAICVKHGIVHKNKAARTVSRLYKRIVS